MLRIEQFLKEMTHGRSLNPVARNTKAAYGMTLRRFEEFLGKRKPTPDLAQSWIRHLMEEGLEMSSVSRYGAALRKYLEFENLDTSKLRLPTPREKLPEYLKKDVLDEFIRRARSPLERALIIVLADTGLRISELLALVPKDIDWEQKLILAHREKAHNEAWVGIDQKALDALTEYIEWAKPKGKIFPHSYAEVYGDLKGLGESMGIKFHPHMLRHTYAILSLAAGVKLPIISQQLGHKKLDTTMRYLRLLPQDLIEDRKSIW